MKKRIIPLLLALVMALSLIFSASAEDAWTCENCGTGNTGNFCSNCGASKPSAEWTCPNCGSVNEGNFCPNCGTRRPEAGGGDAPAEPEPASTISDIRFKNKDGVTTIKWKDSAEQGPYTVSYELSDWTDCSITYEDDPCTSTSCSVLYLIPGQTYTVTVSNGVSSASAEYSVPKSTFTEFSKKNMKLNKTYIDASEDEGYYSTIKLELYYPQLKKDREYNFLMVLKTPLGYCSYIYWDDAYTLGRKYIGFRYNLSMSDYFDAVKLNYGKVPTGEYSIEVYFNGGYYNSIDFKVKGRK